MWGISSRTVWRCKRSNTSPVSTVPSPQILPLVATSHWLRWTPRFNLGSNPIQLLMSAVHFDIFTGFSWFLTGALKQGVLVFVTELCAHQGAPQHLISTAVVWRWPDVSAFLSAIRLLTADASVRKTRFWPHVWNKDGRNITTFSVRILYQYSETQYHFFPMEIKIRKNEFWHFFANTVVVVHSLLHRHFVPAYLKIPPHFNTLSNPI